MLVGIISIANASIIPNWCYQEFANQTSSCGGLDTGLYEITGSWDDGPYIIDGNWTTYSNASKITSAELFINYTKHPDSTGAIWTYRDINGYLNETIIQDCWDVYNDTLRLMISKGFRDDYLDYWCYNGTDWYKLTCCTTTPMILYEEAIYWNTSYDVPDITIYSPTNTRYYTTSILVNWTATDKDGISEMIWNNGTTNFTYTSPLYVDLSHGNYTFYFYAKDTEGYLSQKSVNFQVHAPETTPAYTEIHFLALTLLVAIAFTYFSYSRTMEYVPILHILTAIFWIFIGLSTIQAIQYYFSNAYSFYKYTIRDFPYQYISGFLIAMIGIGMIFDFVINNMKFEK